jgi:hypothetical protein
MARLDISNIDMNEIHVKVGGASNAQVSLNDTDVRGMAAPDSTYAGADGISTGNNSTIAIGEFRNGEHTSLDDFFSLSSWDTFNVDSVANNGFGTAQAFCQMAFKNDTANSRIECLYYGGTTQNMALTYTSYINYTGYTGNINVKYTTSGVITPGNPTLNIGDGDYTYQPHGWPGSTSNSASITYTSSRSRKSSGTNYVIPTTGYVPFKWFVEGPPRGNGYSNSGFDSVTHAFTFTVSFVSDSVTYSSTSGNKRVEMYAGRGPLQL